FRAPARASHDQEPRPLARFALSSSHSLFKFALEQTGKAKTGVSPRCRRIQFHNPRVFSARFGESLRRGQVKGEKCSCLWIDWVQVDCLAIEFDSSIHVSACY